ncbi:hypothetical protein FQN50_003712 [Emmonsiellopsis sp. PD_5]|nr:hypothetical protein FQN50_003712 [Emmonsiellopsis sp. PD_5]
MPTHAQIQALLRFLTQDSKLPLTTAMTTVNSLVKADLTTPDKILEKDVKTLQTILGEQKTAKQILNAARRVTKKRALDEDSAGSPTKKPRKTDISSESSPTQVETALALPISSDMDEISRTVLFTNRAPLVLAFAVVVLRYTMPEQPLSSRLSLAQAVVSANSRTKATILGIETGQNAEDEGWGRGQPTAKVLGREISVLKRHGYNWTEEISDEKSTTTSYINAPKTEEDRNTASESSDEQPALWGLDLESMRQSNDKASAPRHTVNPTLPIHRPEPARDYLLKSFAPKQSTDPSVIEEAKKKKKPSMTAAEREAALGLLLGAIDLLCKSWASVLSKDELDRRAWSWYVTVRPDVQTGVGGWGQKGLVHLSKILDLGRKA